MREVTVADVMTHNVVTVGPETGFREIADLLVNRQISAVPVTDDAGVVLGMVSEADLLAKLEYSDRPSQHPLVLRRSRAHRAKAGGDTAVDVMTAPAVTTTPDTSVAGAARAMEAARVKRLPVIDAHRHLVGIVSRRDLVRTYVRTDDQLRHSVLVVIDALWIDPGPLTVDCHEGVVYLSGRLDRRSTTQILAKVVRSTAGVVDVVSTLRYDFDDTDRKRASTVTHPNIA